jgi:competence protein ComEC
VSPFRLPLIPIFLVYAVGLYLGYFDFPLPSQALILVLLTLLASWVLCLIIKKTALGSWIAFSLFFTLGIFSIHLYLHPPHSPSHISHFNGFYRITLEGILDRPPEVSQGGTRLLIRSEKVILPNRHIYVDGHLLLFLKEEYGPFHMGDRLRFLCKLYSPRGFRNPGGFSYERHLAFERIQTVGFLSEKRVWAKTGEGFKNPLLLRIEGWRDQIRDFLETKAHPLCSGIFETFVLGEKGKIGIFEALVLGEQGKIPEEVKDYFIVTGIAHLLAISADQFGIVAFLSFSLLIWTLKRSELLLLSTSVKKWAAALTIPCLLLYTFIAGGGISVIRAMIMVTTFFLSILFDRERNVLHTLALAAFLILIFSPPSLFDVSFQLSFLAVLSIVYLVPRILQTLKRDEILPPLKKSRMQRIWKYMKLSLLVTAVATLGTAPFVALHFNRISPIGLVTNLFAIPWVGFLIVPLSLLASVFSFFFSLLATLLIQVDGFITLILLRVLAFFASIPFASLFVSTPTALEIVLFYLLLLTLLHLRKRKGIRYFFLGVCLALILDIAFWNLKGFFQKDLTITFIDVGHGDSILVEFPKGKKMLIDGGGLHDDRFDTGKNVIAPFLWKKKINRIDYLVLTHPDPDHLKGLNFIASHFSIGQFWDNGLPVDSESYRQLQGTLSSQKIVKLSLNNKSPSQMINGVQISILNPVARSEFPRKDRNRLFLNNQSLVMKLHFKNIGVLLAADIGEQVEYRMIREGSPLRAEVLKVPHHGSSSSSTSLFLHAVKPTCAILSVGERNIGRLPNPEVLKRYQEIGSRIFRTDQHGAIIVVTDGEKIQVKPFL